MYHNFSDMPVWQRAMNLAVEVFNISSKLPRSEDYGLTSPANSVSANISEGFGRNTNKDKSQFYIIARGSLLKHRII
jgi:four helix bundle protein